MLFARLHKCFSHYTINEAFRLGFLQFPEDLVTFIEEILHGKLHFLCSVRIEVMLHIENFSNFISTTLLQRTSAAKESLRHHSIYKMSELYSLHLHFSNISTDATVILKDKTLNDKFMEVLKISGRWNLRNSCAASLNSMNKMLFIWSNNTYDCRSLILCRYCFII